MTAFFTRVSTKITGLAGSPWATVLAVTLVLSWVVGSFFIGFTNTAWNFAANTTTTLITFIMVFIVQSTQNRDSVAIQTKLDALLNADSRDEDDMFMGIEDLTEDDIRTLKDRIKAEAQVLREKRRQ